MKRGNIEFGVLIAVAAVAVLGSVFMFSANNEASAMATWEYPSSNQQKILTCELGCYQAYEKQLQASTNPAPQSLQHCITYCNNLPPY
jgi:hypothetical protein